MELNYGTRVRETFKGFHGIQLVGWLGINDYTISDVI